MKKITKSKILGISLTSIFIWAGSIIVQAATLTPNLDYDNSGIIDTLDLCTLATNYNLKSSDSNWDSKYDLNSDNIVDVFDLVKESKSIGTIPDNLDITDKFTDANLRYHIRTSSSGKILYSDVKNIKELNLSSMNISSLNGIEYLTSLTGLYCYDNNLTTIDLSKNTNLINFECDHNKITTLEVSKNTALTNLSCDDNQLKILDVSKNTALTYLYCSFNQLTTLDISKNIKLDYLFCDDNQLTTLDVSKNTALTWLECYNNQLTTLYSLKNTWVYNCYKHQYTDSTHTTYSTKSLVITVVGDGVHPLLVESVNDINVVKNVGDNYILPTTVPVTLSDGSVKDLPVLWEVWNNVASTSVAGRYWFYGTLTMVNGVLNPGDIDISATLTVTYPFDGIITINNDTDVTGNTLSNEIANFKYNVYCKATIDTAKYPVKITNGARMTYCVYNRGTDDITVSLDVFNSITPNILVNQVDSATIPTNIDAGITKTIVLKPGQSREISGNTFSEVPVLHVTSTNNISGAVNVSAKAEILKAYQMGTSSFFTTISTAKTTFVSIK